MLHRPRVIAIVCIAATLSLGCKNHHQSGAATRPMLEGIYYHRTGGIAGTNDRVDIDPHGAYVTSGRMIGDHRGRLSDGQIAQISVLFEGWEKLKSDYPAPPHTFDDMVVQIRYGSKTVTASDAAPDVPETFRKVREAIEQAVSPPASH